MTPRCEVIGDCTLWLGDALELREQFDTTWAVVSDPPYGMLWDGKVMRGINGTGGKGKTRHYACAILGDDRPFDPTPWLSFREVILWGSNHFAQALPRGTTLVWLKRYDQGFGTFLSDAELAWQKEGHGVYCRRDVSMQGESTTRRHPCQKPVPLLTWCIARCTAQTILDPYMGVASTGVAAVTLGRRFVGVEIDERYWELGCRRIEAAYRQPDMFIEHAKHQAPTQEPLFAKETPCP